MTNESLLMLSELALKPPYPTRTRLGPLYFIELHKLGDHRIRHLLFLTGWQILVKIHKTEDPGTQILLNSVQVSCLVSYFFDLQSTQP